MYSNSKELLSKRILAVFTPDADGKVFPYGYENNVRWWGNIPQEKLHSLLSDGTAKLLTLDLDIGDTCSLNCPHCFRRDSRFNNTKENVLTHEDIVDYVLKAKKLGFQEIKILGRREPFENSRFLNFLTEMTDLGIGVSIFTKGHILGNDELANRYNKKYGIKTAKKLVKKIKKLKVNILLGFNSFNRKMQEQFVVVDKYSASSPLKSYVEFRDQALINLVKAVLMNMNKINLLAWP